MDFVFRTFINLFLQGHDRVMEPQLQDCICFMSGFPLQIQQIVDVIGI